MFSFLSEKFSNILGWMKGRTRLTEKNIKVALGKVEHALIEADVPYDVVCSFLEQVKSDALASKLSSSTHNPGDIFVKLVYDRLLHFLGNDHQEVKLNIVIPSRIMVMGLQGSGKTTTIAKLGTWIKQQAGKRGKSRRVLAASVDFYRPAAVDQLETLCEQADLSFFKAPSSDPLVAAQQINDYFVQNSFEVLLLDTAGRMHIDTDLMNELVHIDQQIKPQTKVLVLDIMTGQQSLTVAQTFDQKVGFTNAIMTKMDSDARGGAAFAFRFLVKKPIVMIGTGEKLGEIEEFIPERMAKRILGMGDIITLLEKAEEQIVPDEQEALARRMIKGKFTLQDFANQMGMVSKLGSFQKILQYLPGSHSITQDQLDKSSKDMKYFKAIINSMTPKERTLPNILNASRKRRIAQGAGCSVQEINQLLDKFEQSKQFVKMLGKSPRSKMFK